MALGANITANALKRLRQRREELGLSQAQVAGAVGVNPSYVGLLERGERVPSLDILLGLCEAVRLAPAELFADANPKPIKDDPELAQIRSLFTHWPVDHKQAAVRVLRELDKLRKR